MTRRGLLLAAAAPERRPAAAWRLSLWPKQGEAASEAVSGAELQVKVNGQPARVRRLGTRADPLVLSVVLDLVGDLTLADPAREALIAGIEKTPASVALLRAQDGLRVLADPGTPPDELAAFVRAVPVSGRAGLFDSMAAAAALADAVLRSARVRSAVLFLTDGLITDYREDYTNPVVNASDANDMSRRFPEGLVKEKIRQVKTELTGTLTPVFVVHLNYRRDRLNEVYQTGLLELAESTGGEATFCRTPADIAPAVEAAFERVAALQVVEVAVQMGKARQGEIEMVAPGRELQYRTRYQPPAPAAKEKK